MTHPDHHLVQFETRQRELEEQLRLIRSRPALARAPRRLRRRVAWAWRALAAR